MSEPRFETGREDTPKTFLDRIEIAGSLALRADITAIYAKVFSYASREDAVNDTSGTQVGTEITYATADVIFDALQTGGMWKKDRTGYNFAAEVPASYFATPGHHRVEFRVDRSAAGEDDFFLPVWFLYVEPIASS